MPTPNSTDVTREAIADEPSAPATVAGDGTGVYEPGSTHGPSGLFIVQPTGTAPDGSNRYELGEEIARGGMGSVHRATDRAFEREVAIKFLRPGIASEQAAVRFFEEARITGQLQHPNIPPVHEVGTTADGRPFLVMKLIRGRTLHDLLTDREGPIDLDRFLRDFEKVCLAVAYAHSRGIIHRDLKPANIMVGTFGEVQVMDWGLAKKLGAKDVLVPGPPDDVPDETRPGTVMGTVSFMPPEQAQGQIDRVDSRSDVFSLGAILAVILTGKPIYQGRTAEEIWRMASVADLKDALARLDRIKPSGKLPRLVALAKRCLQPRPDDRPSHAGEVSAVLAAVREGTEGLKQSEEFRAAVDEYVAEIDKYKDAEREVNRRSRGATITLFGSVATVAILGLYLFWMDASLRGQREASRRLTLGLARVFGAETDREELRKSAEAVRSQVESLTVNDAIPTYLNLAGCYDVLNETTDADACWGRAADLFNRSNKTVANEIAIGQRHAMADAMVAFVAIKQIHQFSVTGDVSRAILRRALAAYEREKGRLSAESQKENKPTVERAKAMLDELEGRKPK